MFELADAPPPITKYSTGKEKIVPLRFPARDVITKEVVSTEVKV
jgi:hypothetical protein